VWAASENFPVSQDEIKAILGSFDKSDVIALKGVNVAGTRYIFLSNSDRVLRAKKGTSGIHVMKTVQAVIICLYQEPVVPEQCATVTEKLGEYLITVGY